MKTFLPINKTLKEAQDYIAENWEEGVKCPCCGQFAKLYKRTLNSGMALGLIMLYKIAPDGKFVHVPTEFTKRKINNSNTELSKLSYWGLIEEKPVSKEDKEKASGYWRITELGIKFVMGKIRVSKFVMVYNGRLKEATQKEMTTIQDALGKKFDYKEIMSSKLKV